MNIESGCLDWLISFKNIIVSWKEVILLLVLKQQRASLVAKGPWIGCPLTKSSVRLERALCWQKAVKQKPQSTVIGQYVSMARAEETESGGRNLPQTTRNHNPVKLCLSILRKRQMMAMSL